MSAPLAPWLQHELLDATAPASPRSAPAGGAGPPQRPREAPRTLPDAATRREWWAALQLPAHVSDAQLQAHAHRALGFTPRVSLSPPDAVLLELRGSVRLFGGTDALVRSLQAAFPAPCRLAFAPTPLAALVFARCAVPARIEDPAHLVGELAPLPLYALRWPEETLRRLAAIGVRSIGAALRLPRAGFARRFGAGTLEMLDRLLGRQGDPRAGFVAPERFRHRCDPDVELGDQVAVLAVLSPLLEKLERFLRSRQRGITSLLVQFFHRRHAPTRHVLRLAAPAWQAAQFLRLLELELQRTGLPAPVCRCELRSGPLVEVTHDSSALWHPGEHGGGAAGTQMPSFLEQLRARLGQDAVTGMALVEEHRPERQSVTAPPQLRPATSAPADLPWTTGRRPLWLLPEPRPLAEQDAWPCREGRRLALLAGPERLETGWWDGADIQRDYYQAMDAAGVRLWIYRERGASRRWYLHGFFG